MKRLFGFILALCLATPMVQPHVGSVGIVAVEGLYLWHELKYAFKKAKSAVAKEALEAKKAQQADKNPADRPRIAPKKKLPALTFKQFISNPTLIKKHARTKRIGASLIAMIAGIVCLELRGKNKPAATDTPLQTPEPLTGQPKSTPINREIPASSSEPLKLPGASSAEEQKPLDDLDQLLAAVNAAPADPLDRKRVCNQKIEKIAATADPMKQAARIIKFQEWATYQIMQRDQSSAWSHLVSGLGLKNLKDLKSKYPEQGTIFDDIIYLVENPNVQAAIKAQLAGPFFIAQFGAPKNVVLKKIRLKNQAAAEYMLLVETETHFNAYRMTKHRRLGDLFVAKYEFTEVKREELGLVGQMDVYNNILYGQGGLGLLKQIPGKGVINWTFTEYIEYLEGTRRNFGYQCFPEEQPIIDEINRLVVEFLRTEEIAYNQHATEIEACFHPQYAGVLFSTSDGSRSLFNPETKKYEPESDELREKRERISNAYNAFNKAHFERLREFENRLEKRLQELLKNLPTQRLSVLALQGFNFTWGQAGSRKDKILDALKRRIEHVINTCQAPAAPYPTGPTIVQPGTLNPIKLQEVVTRDLVEGSLDLRGLRALREKHLEHEKHLSDFVMMLPTEWLQAMRTYINGVNPPNKVLRYVYSPSHKLEGGVRGNEYLIYKLIIETKNYFEVAQIVPPQNSTDIHTLKQLHVTAKNDTHDILDETLESYIEHLATGRVLKYKLSAASLQLIDEIMVMVNEFIEQEKIELVREDQEWERSMGPLSSINTGNGRYIFFRGNVVNKLPQQFPICFATELIRRLTDVKNSLAPQGAFTMLHVRDIQETITTLGNYLTSRMQGHRN